MSLHRAEVFKVTHDTASNGSPFVRMQLKPGGYANCYDRDLFRMLRGAENRGPVDLDLVQSEGIDQRTGQPFNEVVGMRDELTGNMLRPRIDQEAAEEVER